MKINKKLIALVIPLLILPVITFTPPINNAVRDVIVGESLNKETISMIRGINVAGYNFILEDCSGGSGVFRNFFNNFAKVEQIEQKEDGTRLCLATSKNGSQYTYIVDKYTDYDSISDQEKLRAKNTVDLSEIAYTIQKNENRKSALYRFCVDNKLKDKWFCGFIY